MPIWLDNLIVTVGGIWIGGFIVMFCWFLFSKDNKSCNRSFMYHLIHGTLTKADIDVACLVLLGCLIWPIALAWCYIHNKGD